MLANAFVKICESQKNAHFKLLMIGNGERFPLVKEIIDSNHLNGKVFFPGYVDSEKIPEYLSICDILVSPHVNNTDGSEFFGSPTKLFEYMASGRAIVASNLAQLGSILTHKNALPLIPEM